MEKTETFVVARVLNRHRDLDYLIGLDTKDGTVASLSIERAHRFADRGSAVLFMEQAQQAVPYWYQDPFQKEPRPIEYVIIDGPPRASGAYPVYDVSRSDVLR